MFEWDSRKAALNLKDHGVSFEDATTVFDDPYALDGPDPDHSIDEPRFLRLGLSAVGRLLVVSYTERGVADAPVETIHIRIISARRATPQERENYIA